MVTRLPAMQETWVQSLGWEDPLEKEMATHSSILVWRISWTEEPNRLQFMGLKRLLWSESLITSPLLSPFAKPILSYMTHHSTWLIIPSSWDTLSSIISHFELPRWLTGKEFTCQCRRMGAVYRVAKSRTLLKQLSSRTQHTWRENQNLLALSPLDCNHTVSSQQVSINGILTISACLSMDICFSFLPKLYHWWVKNSTHSGDRIYNCQPEDISTG